MLQAFLLGMIAFIAQSEFALGTSLISRPIVTGLFTGIVMGDIKAGVIMGATLELAFIGSFSVGGAIPPDVVTGGILGVAFAIASKSGVETVLLLALPIATFTLILKNVYLGIIIPMLAHKADAYAEEGNDAVVQVFFVRNGKLIGREHFYLTTVPGDTGKDILTSFIKQYYIGTPFIPRELLVQEEVEEPELLSQLLSRNQNYTVRIVNPKKGSKEKLVELAAKNAGNLLEQNKEKYRREQKRTVGAVEEIEELIGITGIHRMEAYDISNTNGYESVASMIVYEDGKPKRNNYRKFRIKSVKGPDDYASMREVLTRRFRHGIEEREKLDMEEKDYKLGSFSNFPDILMMDGGKGQVNIALEVLDSLNLHIPVCGMVKDDNHRTRGLYYNNEEIPIAKNSEGFRLITRMQDETHRFAIEYHRSLRNKKQVHSILDDIPGVGPARRKALMREFKSIEGIREATVEQLSQVDTISEKVAKDIYKFFH